VGIGVALLLLLTYALRGVLRPGAPVRVVRVVATEAPVDEQGASATGEVSVQAPGWVEPDPYPIYVSALTRGIVREVLVLEGERVEAGQVVARLVAEDAELAVRRAEAELQRAEATLKASRVDLEQPVALTRAVGVQRAALARAGATTARMQARVLQEEATLEALKRRWERLRGLSAEAAAPQEVDDAEFAFRAQQARLTAARQSVAEAQAAAKRLQVEVQAARQDLHLKVDEQQAFGVSQARVRDAQAALEQAQLRLERMEVVSPAAGVVMARLAVPGGKLTPEMGGPFSAHVVHLYDPDKLQVRVDVPLADAARVGVGQAALVVVDVLPEREFVGRVTRLVHRADISKNTVQVKVAILEPLPLLKPDMLARVKFIAASAQGGVQGSAGLQVLVPADAVRRQGERGLVWRVDPRSSRLQRLEVSLGATRADGWVSVREGLQAGDVLVDQPGEELEEGRLVRPLEEAAWR